MPLRGPRSSARGDSHRGRAAFHCAVNVVAISLNMASEYGDAHIGFATTLAVGICLTCVSVVIWLRDLTQLLRGRLGPRRVPPCGRSNPALSRAAD